MNRRDVQTGCSGYVHKNTGDESMYVCVCVCVCVCVYERYRERECVCKGEGSVCVRACVRACWFYWLFWTRLNWFMFACAIIGEMLCYAASFILQESSSSACSSARCSRVSERVLRWSDALLMGVKHSESLHGPYCMVSIETQLQPHTDSPCRCHCVCVHVCFECVFMLSCLSARLNEWSICDGCFHCSILH